MAQRKGSGAGKGEPEGAATLAPASEYEALFAGIWDLYVVIEEALDQPDGLLDPGVIPDLLAAKHEILEDLWGVLQAMSTTPLPGAEPLSAEMLRSHGLQPKQQRWKASQLRLAIEQYRSARMRHGRSVRRPDQLDSADRSAFDGATQPPSPGSTLDDSDLTDGLSIVCQSGSTLIDSFANGTNLGTAAKEAVGFIGIGADGFGRAKSRLRRLFRRDR